jgi:hypothetical protein
VEKLLRLVELRAEILELMPYKANVYPYDPMTGGDRDWETIYNIYINITWF